MATEKKHFKIVERQPLSQETIEKVIKEYTETSNSKMTAALSASNKFGVSQRQCINILKNVPKKPRKLVRKVNPVEITLEGLGGFGVVKALRYEGYSIAQIANYLNISYKRLYAHLKKEGWVVERKTGLTHQEVARIKKEHGLV